MGSSYGQFIVVLLIFVGVLALTYYVTRWVAGYQKGRSSGSNIQLIESAPLATNKYIQIVRIGDKYFALAISKDSTTLISELSQDEIKLPMNNGNGKSFKDILSHAKSFNDNSENE